MNTLEAYNELIRLSKELLIACDEYKKDAVAYARKENDYRRAKAMAYLNSEGTVEARKAKVDQICEDQRLEAHLAEAMKEASGEKLKSLRSALSAYQSFCSGYKTEAEFGRTGPLSVVGTGR